MIDDEKLKEIEDFAERILPNKGFSHVERLQAMQVLLLKEILREVRRPRV